MTCKIEKITNPFAWELYQARLDQSIVTGKPLIERPFHYENTETGQLYYDLYGCLAWPSEVSDKDEGMPGYAAVVGIIKSKKDEKPENALFQLLTETESKDVPTLLNNCIKLRIEYGFGLHPTLLQAWFGDPEIFVTTLALYNEKRIAEGGDKAAVLIIPPDDFYDTKRFDNYVRSLRSCIMPANTRFYFGKNEILKNRLREFRDKDPAVLGAGGLVHSLLSRCEWLDQTRENAFNVEEEEELVQ